MVFRNAILTLADGGQVTVVIKNLSATGARVDYFPAVELTQRVTLSEATLKLHREARVVWRDGSAAGLVFED